MSEPVAIDPHPVADRPSLRSARELLGCRNNKVLDLHALGERLGFDHSTMHDVLTPKLKCSRCGSTGRKEARPNAELCRAGDTWTLAWTKVGSRGSFVGAKH